MTPTKILRRLATLGPIIIDRHAKPGGRCVMATRCCIVTLAQFGIDASPLSVRIVIHNQAMAAFLNDLGDRVPTTADWEGVREAGGHTLDAGDLSVPLPNVVHRPGGRDWNGHLMAAVPRFSSLVDLDLQQFCRPAKQIRLPPGASFTWEPGTTKHTYPLPGGGIIGIQAQPFNDGWQDAGDWKINADEPVIQELLRAVRKGKL